MYFSGHFILSGCRRVENLISLKARVLAQVHDSPVLARRMLYTSKFVYFYFFISSEIKTRQIKKKIDCMGFVCFSFCLFICFFFFFAVLVCGGVTY